MRTSPFIRSWWLALLALVLATSPARAQMAPQSLPARPIRPSGYITFYTNVMQMTPVDGASVTMGDFITNVRYKLDEGEGDGVEFGVDFRQSSSTDQNRAVRRSLYDGYIGGRFAGGHVRVRGGQMWLNDLGGLGSVTGGVAEYRQSPDLSGMGRLRIGVFAGLEPEAYQLGFTPGVRKAGAYGILEGHGGRRHVAGYVRMADQGLVERSVVTFTNFVPMHSKFFLFQAGEYDLVGPAGQGTGGLTYFMINAHGSPTDRLDLQGLYHRGRSLDTRTITEDILAGRPLSDGALDAYLYSSAGGRATVRLTRDLRVNVGYTQDQNNRDSANTGRVSVGLSTTDIAHSGVDLTVSDSRIRRPTGEYDSLYVSAGRQLGRQIYISGDYSSSVSVVRFTRSDGITVESRPQTKDYGVNSVIQTGRHVSITATLGITKDQDISDVRVLAGMTYRFR
jgi:hypothetical protein